MSRVVGMSLLAVAAIAYFAGRFWREDTVQALKDAAKDAAKDPNQSLAGIAKKTATNFIAHH